MNRQPKIFLWITAHTNINDEQLCSVREVVQTLPDTGESYVICACCQGNIFVQHQSIRDAIVDVDPVSRASRRSICITCIVSQLQIRYDNCVECSWWGVS